MNQTDFDEIKNKIENLIQNNKNGNIFELSKRWGLLESNLDALLKLQEHTISKQEEEDIKSFYDMNVKLEDISKNSSYLDAFLPLFTNTVYNIPTTYFGNQNTPKIMIDLPGTKFRYKLENSDFALRACFPGSTTFRYGSPRKVKCGSFPLSQCDTREHVLSEIPIEDFLINERPVFSVNKLKTIPSRRQHMVCPICLAMQDFDENCNHQIAKRTVKKSPFTQPLFVNKEIEREITKEPKKFRYPLDQIFDEIHFLDHLKMGVALTGFSRTWGGITTDISYSPYIGYVLETKGLSFKLKKLDESTVKELLKVNHIVRDLILGKIGLLIYENCSQYGIPTFHGDLFVSSIIRSLELDRIDDSFDLDELISQINTNEWIEDAIRIFNEESLLFGVRDPYPEEKITEVINSIQNQLTLEVITDFVHEVYANSMAQAVFLAGLTTSGSMFNDVSYQLNSINKFEYEIILFDNVNGGNGSSELIFEYLFLPDADNNSESLHRPRFMDETLMEYILPCRQGIIDRIFYQNISNSINDKNLKPNFAYLDKIKNENIEEYNSATRFGVENMFPRGIGMRHLDEEDDDNESQQHLGNVRTAEKIREIAHMCIHGCPDCISLGSKSMASQYKERYIINKYLVDWIFNKNLSEITLDESTSLKNIETMLNDKKLVRLLKKQYSNESESKIEDFITILRGKKINQKIVKFSGKWFSCPIQKSPYIEISYLLSLT